MPTPNPLLHSGFHGELPLQVYPGVKLAKWDTLGKRLPLGHFFIPFLVFPKQSFQCSLPKTNNQTKKKTHKNTKNQKQNKKKTPPHNLQDMHYQLKPWYFPVIFYKIFKDRIRRNVLKPQKVGELKGSTSLWWLLNTGTGLQREVKEFFLALLSYNSPKAHNALCWWDELHDISSLVQSKGSNLHLKPVLSSVGHKDCRTETQQMCLFIQHQLSCHCSLLFFFAPSSSVWWPFWIGCFKF